MLTRGPHESETLPSDSEPPTAPVKALTLYSIFPEPPDEKVAAEFKAFVAKTGQPECFPGVSTSQPPTDGELQILLDRIAVEQRQRPLWDKIPCSYCSPHAGKWLRGGYLIWCGATAAIYVIGPKCGSNGVFASKVQMAENEYRRTIGAKLTAEQLARHLLAGPARLSWIDQHEAIARQADEVSAYLRGSIELARAIKTAVKDGLLQGSGGGAFLQGGATCVERLATAKADLETLMACMEGAPGDWANSLAPSPCAMRVKEAEKILGNLQAVESRIRSAATFVAESGVGSLVKWSRSNRAPAMLKLEQVSTRVKIWWKDKLLELSINSIPSPTAVP